MVLFWPRPAHSSRCKFTKNMTWSALVVSIYRPSDSGSGGSEGPKFIRCVGGQEPQMHEVWCFSPDIITREVHPVAQVDVGAKVVGHLLSDSLTENGCRIPILGQISNNGSVEYLVIPDFHRAGGTFWSDNNLVPRSTWGNGGNTTNQNWGIQPGGAYNKVSVTWCGAVPSRPTYIARIP